ncbi:excalibur calcium-binding domain-containing protein [Hamadaea sp.]|uniref:excalibur calcium-binding domain-containing protein n=1 Tax=Hamadaea sp. TaxID=2024425 RepID=UPI0025BCC365|nr:excalibur calcium-binding domain-containing protein [Hamadaea sp.]
MSSGTPALIIGVVAAVFGGLCGIGLIVSALSADPASPSAAATSPAPLAYTEPAYTQSPEAVQTAVLVSPTISVSRSPSRLPSRSPSRLPSRSPSRKPACDPNYAGACVPVASDVDCAGGSGNGPAYFSGTARVVGTDIYDLDRDNDGIACEKD